MKNFDNLRVYAWLEFAIWLLIIAICVFGFRYYHHKQMQQFKSYQIFMNDVDGLIVGSPVRFLGIQIGHVTKLQLLSSKTSSDIYVKFIITQKDLTLPIGAIATVEGSGLGGSKSLEIYPPDKDTPTDKIIVPKDSTRLNRVMSLFNQIFKDIEQIFTTIGNTATELSSDAPKVQKNIVTPVDAEKRVINLNQKLDNFIEAEKKLKKQLQNVKKIHKESKNESGESQSNK